MWLKVILLSAMLPMYGCSALAPRVDSTEQQALNSPWSQTATLENTSVAPTPWQHYKFPGKPANQISYAKQNGRHAMLVTAISSASMLRQTLHVAPQDLASVKFSWKVPELIAQADMAVRDADDSPVRIVLAFEGDRSKFSGKNAMLSELTQVLTGEPMPYATLMYVWCNKRAPGSVIVNPRTDRIRELVVESGMKNLNQWMDYERDIRADFEKAFGEMPGALIGIGIMTDTDNTRTTARAWYGPVKLAAR